VVGGGTPTTGKNDCIYHIWERRPKWIAINNREIFNQKLEYVHNNPIQERWKLVMNPADYRWSSAAYYAGEANELTFISEL
jgi:putative transposase